MKTKAFLILVALQALVIVGLSAYHAHQRSSGVSILLETAPVDPRDLLRGDYVILNYKISRLSSNLFNPPLTGTLTEGRTLYVTLERKDPFHEAVRVGFDRPEIVGPGQAVLTGTVRHSWREGEVMVEYGLERYYVAEGTGNPVGRMTVEVSVPDSGRGIIREVFLDDKPYAEVMGEVR